MGSRSHHVFIFLLRCFWLHLGYGPMDLSSGSELASHADQRSCCGDCDQLAFRLRLHSIHLRWYPKPGLQVLHHLRRVEPGISAGGLFLVPRDSRGKSFANSRKWHKSIANSQRQRTLEDLNEYFDKDSPHGIIIRIGDKVAKQHERPQEVIDAEQRRIEMVSESKVVRGGQKDNAEWVEQIVETS